jgi:hypothetical protein
MWHMSETIYNCSCYIEMTVVCNTSTKWSRSRSSLVTFSSGPPGPGCLGDLQQPRRKTVGGTRGCESRPIQRQSFTWQRTHRTLGIHDPGQSRARIRWSQLPWRWTFVIPHLNDVIVIIEEKRTSSLHDTYAVIYYARRFAVAWEANTSVYLMNFIFEFQGEALYSFWESLTWKLSKIYARGYAREAIIF